MGRVEAAYKEYIRKGMDIAVALAMAHRDETDRIASDNRPPVEIPTYVYVEPLVTDEDRGPDEDDIPWEPEVPVDVEISVPTAHAGGLPAPVLEDGFSHESLPGKVYKTAPALKAALTALAKREANAN